MQIVYFNHRFWVVDIWSGPRYNPSFRKVSSLGWTNMTKKINKSCLLFLLIHVCAVRNSRKKCEVDLLPILPWCPDFSCLYFFFVRTNFLSNIPITSYRCCAIFSNPPVRILNCLLVALWSRWFLEEEKSTQWIFDGVQFQMQSKVHVLGLSTDYLDGGLWT